MRSETEIKQEICRLFRLREMAQLRHKDSLAERWLTMIATLEWTLGDPPDGSWAAYQRYLLAT